MSSDSKPSNEPIYHDNVLTAVNDPQQTLYNCRCMLSMVGMKDIEGVEIEGEAAVGFGLILHQVQSSLEELGEDYDFTRKSKNE